MESGELKAKKETALSMAEEGMDIQKIYRQLDVVESTDLEYNKYIAEEQFQKCCRKGERL